MQTRSVHRLYTVGVNEADDFFDRVSKVSPQYAYVLKAMVGSGTTEMSSQRFQHLIGLDADVMTDLQLEMSQDLRSLLAGSYEGQFWRCRE